MISPYTPHVMTKFATINGDLKSPTMAKVLAGGIHGDQNIAAATHGAVSSGAVSSNRDANISVAPKLPTAAERLLADLAEEEKSIPVQVIDPNTLGAGAVTICHDPNITIIPNFLTLAECHHLIALTMARQEPAKVFGMSAAEYRTSSTGTINFYETPIVCDIEARAAQLAGFDLRHLEKLCCVSYSPGQFYKAHHDGEWRPKHHYLYLSQRLA